VKSQKKKNNPATNEQRLTAKLNGRPQVDRTQRDRIETLVEAGKKDGELIFGGKKYGEKACRHVTLLIREA